MPLTPLSVSPDPPDVVPPSAEVLPALATAAAYVRSEPETSVLSCSHPVPENSARPSSRMWIGPASGAVVSAGEGGTSCTWVASVIGSPAA